MACLKIAAVPGQPKNDRRAAIAEAGIQLIADGGARALTHRAIDATLSLPAGSTSYYARTRRDLVRLVIQKLAERTELDLSSAKIPDELTVEQASQLIAHSLDVTQSRTNDHAARISLLLEYRNEPDMLRELAGNPPVRPQLVAAAEMLLARIGVEVPGRHAPDLVALVDGLLLLKVIHQVEMDADSIIRAYLAGISGSG